FNNFILKTTLGSGNNLPQRLGRLDLPASGGGTSVIDTINGYAYLDNGQKFALSNKNLITASQLTLFERAQVTDVRFYSHTASGNLRLAIYDNSSPKNLLWQSNSTAN